MTTSAAPANATASSRPALVPAFLAAERALEASRAVLLDRRSSHVEAIPLLALGFKRLLDLLLQHARSTGPTGTLDAALAATATLDLPGIPAAARAAFNTQLATL